MVFIGGIIQNLKSTTLPELLKIILNIWHNEISENYVKNCIILCRYALNL